ncbi:MAG: YbaK/EbsC family protein [Pseudomonadota bacterium]
MGKSTTRVQAALEAAGVETQILHLPASTRTADDAARACDCNVAQIVKSLIFTGSKSGKLLLLLVSGAHQVDLAAFAEETGEPLLRADPKDVRARTGFAIGGVAPVGHLEAPATYMDRSLLDYDMVWAAAGAPNAVFQIKPDKLADMTGAALF